LQYDEVVKQ